MKIAKGQFGEENTEYRINPEIIKSMIFQETAMGSESKSPNANSTMDLMQALDPRNPNVYNYVSINHEGGENVRVIGEDGGYVPLKELSDQYGCNPDATKKYQEFIVTEKLFSEQSNGIYYYNYKVESEEIMQNISIAVGTNYYATLYISSGGNHQEALDNYNGSATKEKYALSVLGRVPK